jgi:Leucine-rich repeat (LRR) protein
LLLGAVFVSQASAFGINVTCSFVTVSNVNTCRIRNALVLIDDEPVNIFGTTSTVVEAVEIFESRTLYIMSELFEKFENLKTFSIKGSGLKYIVPGVFRNASNLGTLIIEDNNLDSLETGAFNGLDSLMTLTIHNSNLKRLSPGAIANLLNVRSISLDGLNFPTLPAGAIENLPKLSSINMKALAFTSFESGALKNLPALKVLMMVKLNFTVLPSFGIDAPNLDLFQISDSHLEEIESEAFNGSTVLKNLKVSDANLKKIDEKAFLGLRSVETIDFSWNNIQELPRKALHPLRSLVKAFFDYNHISRLDNDLFLQNGAHVSQLSFKNNNVTSVGPEFFDNLVSLTNFYFTGNLCANKNFAKSNSDFAATIRADLSDCFDAYEEKPTTTLVPTESITLELVTSTGDQTTTTPSSSTVRIDPENPETEKTFVFRIRGKFVIFDDNGNELFRV